MMKRFVSYTIILLILVIPTSLPCFAQFTYEIDKSTRFERIAAEQGLSSKFLTYIHQDKYGFVWIGSQIGLNLYNGYEFKIFKSNTQDTGAIYNDHIFNIYEEADGTMWFCTYNGISKYNRANQTFVNYVLDSLDRVQHSNKIIVQDGDDFWINVWNDLYRFNKETGEFTSYAQKPDHPSRGIMGNNSRCIFMDKSGDLWVGSGGEGGKYYLSKFIKETDEFIHFQNDPSNPESFSGKEVWSMIEDKDGNIWIATDGGGLLKIIDKENGGFKRYNHIENDPNSILTNELYFVFEDSKDNLWIGGDGGFSILDKDVGQFTNYHIPNISNNLSVANKIAMIIESKKGEFWMDAWEGIFRYNPSTNVLHHYLSDPENLNSLSSNTIRTIFFDQSDQLWVVLNNSGLNRINEFSNAFRRVQKKTNVAHSLSSNGIGEFYADSKGNLWIATGGGLNRTKLNKQKAFTNFEHFTWDPDDSKTMSSNTIFSMHEDGDQNLWFGTGDGLNKYDYESNSFTRYYHDPDDSSTISPGTIESIFEDSHGTLWIGTRSGLNIYDKTSDKFIRFIHDDNNPASLLSPSVRAIVEDSFGDIWFGGTFLEKLNRKDTSFIHFYPGNQAAIAVAPTEIWDIAEDDSANLWVQTMRNGIYKMNRNDTTYTILKTKQGLPSNFVSSIEFDENGDLWASSNQGLSRIRADDYEIKNFNIEDGLTNLEFSGINLFKDDDGWMYLGGNLFHPDSVKENKYIPPVYITSLSVTRNKKYFEKPLFEISQIELKHNENDLSIDYIALNYINSKKNNYAFMLQGYDEDWNYVENRRTAYYTNLSPGSYTFRVMGSNNDGYWNEEGASLDIIIHPPIWATWWAYILYIALFFYVIYIIFRFYLRRQQLVHTLELKQVESDKLKELDHLKSRFFNNISHEFRTPLTLVLGPLEKLLLKTQDSSDKKELTIAKKYAGRLQTMINQLLTISKLESGKLELHASKTDLTKLVGGFLQSYESLAIQKNIQLDFNADSDEIIVFIDLEKFEQILSNLLSNAFKFTSSNGTITVNVSTLSSPITLENKQAMITVTDSGQGIPPIHVDHIFDRFYQAESADNDFMEGTGIGLALTKELVDLHHGKISVESRVGKGSTFTILIPLGSKHLKPKEIVEQPTEHFKNLPPGDFNNEDEIPVLGNLPTNGDDRPILSIVEDNADMRAYIRGYFERDFDIIEAVDGSDGFEKSIDYIPDIIISDVMMPKMDGNVFCEKVKTDVRTSHIPVILLTARASKENRIESLETGADDFITKPFDGEELKVRVANLIRQRKKLQEHYLKEMDISESMVLTMDEQFIQKATDVVMKNLSNSEYTVGDFASDMALSRNQLHRKLHALVDTSSSSYIRTIRLNYAADLLAKKTGSVSEIAYDSGFNNPTYFSISFRQQFGMSPSEYQNK